MPATLLYQYWECNFTADIVSALECNLAEIQCKRDVEMSSIPAKDKVSFR